MKLKICCIGSVEEMRLAVESGADAIGLVGAMPSGPGVISDELARSIAIEAPDTMMTVLLSSFATGSQLAEHVEYIETKSLQVVRHIPVREYKIIRAKAKSRYLIQVIHVTDESSIETAENYSNYADALLLDSGKPQLDSDVLGGTGKTHNWEVSKKIVESVNIPVFLAGGLNPENVEKAIDTVGPYGIDVCSGLRDEQGRLKPDALQKFASIVKSQT